MFLFLAGSVDGFLLSAFVVLTWSWYSLREMPLRLLVWALVGHKVVFLLGCTGGHLQEHVSFGIVLASSAVCLVLPLIPLDLIGRPLEVSWLGPHQKAWLARRAASHKLDSCTKDGTPSHRWTHVVSYCRPLMFFGLSLLVSLGEQDAIGESQAFDEVPMLLVLVIVGLAMSEDVSVSFAAMSMCSVIPPIVSILSQSISEGHEGFAVRILTRLNEVVLPLLWSSIVCQASTWPEAIGVLLASLVGLSAGNMILYYFQPMASLMCCIIGLAAKVTLWGLWWIMSM
ncbi:3-hydroxyisobutyrate dehydrogenase [Fusarium keratoplasticum]|uniref:3-hydroxyisobutyrate dehydrogenase n=1 Tax=Fusarium keratoplasticum TaxID=1328300 RepID=A0ACC0QXX3_9HYPO|nr:3-hydroxyisobutyrate dehydrogenase [Fusarium keratoplasticum]KAI8670408.1 3-hydroxyisobutyrate dehydrogenase [Fusarium keratoplasticum]